MTDEDYAEDVIGGTPGDLHELYMTARADIFGVRSFYVLYFKLLFLINIGKEMLPNDHDGIELRNEAVKIVNNPKTYPQPSQMEYTSSGNYRISTGGHDTGLIEVRQEDIGHGRDEAREQKATSLLPMLRDIDSKIFKKLVDVGTIDIKNPSMEDLLTDDVMMSIQTQMREQEEKEVEEEDAI